MNDPFHSSKYCISHAERRICELIGIVNAFIKTRPCKAVTETDRKTGEDVLKIKLIKPMPIEVPGIVFDAINNLRSALDHAGFATAIASGSKGNHAHFPFGDTRRELMGRRIANKGRSRDIPDKIFKAMVKCKPYRRGNGLLWALNNLCNENKHEIIIPFAMGSNVLSFSISRSLAPVRFPSRRSKSWDRTKNERELARIGHGAKFSDNCQVATYIVFDQMKVVGFRPVDNVLRDMFVAVRDTLNAIEAEAIRIGLFR